MGQIGKNLPAMLETQVQFLGWEDPLEKGMANHCSILAWRIPCAEESGRLQSMGSQLDMTERLTLCRKKVMFLPMGSGRKSSSLLVGGSAFLFYSGLSLIERSPTTLERAICFTQSTDSNINLL